MRLAAIAAFLLVSTSALADDVKCDKAVTQNDLNMCAEDDYKAADKALNDAWGTLSDAAKARLRPEQRGWIAARDAKCKSVAAEAEGGSMYPLLYFGCMAEWTKTRTRQLRAASP